MAANLIGQLQHEFSDDVIAKLASFLNETPARTQSALGYAIPAVAGGFYEKAQTPQGASDLVGMLQRGGFAEKPLGSIANLLRFAGGPSDLIKTGGSLLSSLFGARQTNVTDSIAASSGLGKQASTSLFALAASFFASTLGNEAKASGGFNATSLANLLLGQKPFLAAAAPAGLAQTLGVSTWERADDPARVYERAEAAPARAYDREERRGGLGWLLFAIPLLLLGLAFWGWRASRPTEPVRSSLITPPSAGLPAAVPVLVKRKLSCGQELDVAENGVESRLVAFIDDTARPVNDTTWFGFDRLEFETGSATVTAGSLPQIRNVATIMTCYPNVNLKVGGYTDNVGDPSANLQLSQARAQNTVAAIVSQGIPPARLEAEGYGEQHPVASNDTPEGRQRNRRIDLRVTRK